MVANHIVPMHEYQPGTWGSPQADALIKDYGGWANPNVAKIPT
jgi:hypothetical protein